MLKRSLFIASLLALVALFLAGVGRLCMLRFRSGDVYPQLSSLRGDPLGVKALHDAIEETGDLEVHRNYRPLYRLQSRPTGTLFYLGAEMDGRTEDWDDLWQLAAAGNRVVIAFAPVISAPSSKPTPVEAKKSPTPDESKKPTEKKKAKKSTKEEPDEAPFVVKWISWEDALKRVGVKMHSEKQWERQELKAHAAAGGIADSLETEISWHSIAWLETSGTNHKALYVCSEKSVITEVAVGKGSLVLATDSYFLTNEALRKERAPKLLSALISTNREIVFDEYHLHSIEQSGVSTLILQYRLEGVFVVFAFLAGLYVWKNASPLIPRADESAGGSGADETVTGRDATEGFVNLLRRSIPPARVISVCVDEWNNAFGHRRGNTPQPEPESGADPVNQFSELAKKLSNKRTR